MFCVVIFEFPGFSIVFDVVEPKNDNPLLVFPNSGSHNFLSLAFYYILEAYLSELKFSEPN